MIILTISLSITCILLFSFVTRVDGLNRTIIHIPTQTFQIAVPLVNDDDEISLYYSQNKVEDNLRNYLDDTVYHYVDSYEIDFYFYNTNNGGVCDIKDCQGVEVSFSAPINTFYTYHRTMFYEIRRMII